MKKKSVALIVVGIVIAVLLGVIALLLFKMSMGEAKPVANVTTTEVPKNDTGITVENSSISFANMKLGNEKLHLSDEQKEVLKYFDNDYFMVYSYEDLQRYPDVYKGAQIEIGATVKKIIKSTDQEYEMLVQTSGPFIMEDWGIDFEDDKQCYVVIKGKQITKRFIEGDKLNVYGVYKSIDTYNVDGTSYTVPTINVYNTTSDDKRFDLDTVKNVANYIFGKDIKLSNPNETEQVTPFYSYLVTLDNQSNNNFNSFIFSQQSGYVSDLRNYENGYYDTKTLRQLYISADLKHYLITVYNKDTKIMCLDYYDSDLKKLWSREFENTTSFPMDYTSDEIALVADNDFYLIDTKNGKDKIEPTFVGEKLRVIMDEKGVLLFGKTKKDLVMNVDYKGRIKWTVDAKHKILYNDEYDQNIEGLQIVNGNYVLVYTGDDDSEKATDEYSFGVGTCYLVIDKSGNVVLDENNKPDYDNY